MSVKLLGIAVVGRRRYRKIDVKTAAEQIGISQTTLSRVEAGRDPDLTTLRSICRWLEIAPSVFLDDMDEGGAPAIMDPPTEVDHIGEPPSEVLQ